MRIANLPKRCSHLCPPITTIQHPRHLTLNTTITIKAFDMSLFNLLRIALRALQRNKLRAFLTMLGIIIGVASVIAMVAIGQGSKQSIQSALSGMGSNMIIIRPNSNISAGARLDATTVQTLTLDDVKAAYARNFTREGAILMFSGDVTPQRGQDRAVDQRRMPSRMGWRPVRAMWWWRNFARTPFSVRRSTASCAPAASRASWWSATRPRAAWNRPFAAAPITTTTWWR